MSLIGNRYRQRELVTDGKYRKELKRHVEYIKRFAIDTFGGTKRGERTSQGINT